MKNKRFSIPYSAQKNVNLDYIMKFRNNLDFGCVIVILIPKVLIYSTKLIK